MRDSPTILSLAAGLVVLSAVFWLIERWRPASTGAGRRREDTRVDVAYWTHRLFHGRRLWRFHAIHHSSKSVDSFRSST